MTNSQFLADLIDLRKNLDKLAQVLTTASFEGKPPDILALQLARDSIRRAEKLEKNVRRG